MDLKMRATGLSSPVDEHLTYFTVLTGEWVIGRIYEVRGSPTRSSLVLVAASQWTDEAARIALLRSKEAKAQLKTSWGKAEDVAQLEKVRCAPNAEPRHGGDRRRGPLTLGAGLGESTRVHRNNAAPILLVPGTALILGVRLACCRERSGIANRPIWPATRS
jgi:hypothetical protein